jgi:hypothetical protein
MIASVAPCGDAIHCVYKISGFNSEGNGYFTAPLPGCPAHLALGYFNEKIIQFRYNLQKLKLSVRARFGLSAHLNRTTQVNITITQSNE